MRSEDDFDLKVVGRIPDALAGAYYRNGPNPQFDPQGPYFPFLGDGMIHAFFLEPNKDGGRARIATAGFAHRNGMPRTRRDACSSTALAHLILLPPTSIRARRTSISSTMPAS
jgi:Retinal pigment epithelial membrane protein